MTSKSLAVLFIVLQLTQNIGCYAECNKCNCGKKSNLWDTVKETVSVVSDNKFVKYGAAAGAALVAAPALLSAAGFGAGGIAAGSLAAAAQGTWLGGVIGGTWTGIGATGLGVTGKAIVAGIGSAAAGLYDTVKVKSTTNDENCQYCCT